jgi:UDP-N-acetyl-D-galactosamine dehydrogenase
LADVLDEHKLTTINSHPELVEGQTKYYTVVIAVAHQRFLSIDLAAMQKEKSVLYNLIEFFGDKVDGRL